MKNRKTATKTAITIKPQGKNRIAKKPQGKNRKVNFAVLVAVFFEVCGFGFGFGYGFGPHTEKLETANRQQEDQNEKT